MQSVAELARLADEAVADFVRSCAMPTSRGQNSYEFCYTLSSPTKPAPANQPRATGPHLTRSRWDQSSRMVRRRKALPITESELRLIAAAAIIGLSKRPKKG